jgi:hypothetical protein
MPPARLACLFVEDKATVLQDQPAQNFVGSNHVLGKSVVVDARVAACGASRPATRRGGPSDSAARREYQPANAAGPSRSANYRVQASGTVSYSSNLAGGGHGSRPGCSCRGKMEYERIRNGTSSSSGGVPSRETPTRRSTDHRLETWGAFLQDRWTSVARPSAWACAWTECRYLPQRAQPAPTWERVFRTRPRLLVQHRASDGTPTICSEWKDGAQGLYGLLQSVQFRILEASNRNA